MTAIYSSALILFLCFVGKNNFVTTASGTDVRIIGGTEVASRSEFSYQASLRLISTNYHICGASIIHTDFSVTAAHCMHDVAGNLRNSSTIIIVVGDLDKSTASSSTENVQISWYIEHSGYNTAEYENDISLLKHQTPLTWSSTVNYIPLANVTPSEGTICNVSGWGTTEYGGITSSQLLYVEVPIANKTECSEIYSSLVSVTEGMICAGYAEGGKDACQGDSGGPLACDGMLAGIVSWGYRCAEAGFPGVYTNIAYYRDWIEVQMEKSTEPSMEVQTDSHIEAQTVIEIYSATETINIYLSNVISILSVLLLLR